MVINYEEAEVTHSNKYNTGGFYFWHFFFNRIMHDVVFRTYSGSKISLTIKGVNVALYPGQRVQLIKVETGIIGYIDVETGNYYYITKDFREMFGRKISIWQLAFLVVFLFLFYLLFMRIAGTYVIYYLIFLFLAFRFYALVDNIILERRMDKVIRSNTPL